MKATTRIRKLRRVRVGCIAVLVAIAAMVIVRLANDYRSAGSLVTNPDAYASAHIVDGLRLAAR